MFQYIILTTLVLSQVRGRPSHEKQVSSVNLNTPSVNQSTYSLTCSDHVAELTDSLGVISVPYYPNEHRIKDCRWNLRAEQGEIIHLYLEIIDLDCKAGDFVEVSDVTGYLFTPNCVGRGQHIISTTNEVNVTYNAINSDHSYEGMGFIIMYAYDEAEPVIEKITSEACINGAEFNANSGSVHSDGYQRNNSGSYEPHSYCSWLIRVDDGKKIELKFESFDVESPCHFDNVTIYDGDNAVGTDNLTFCGTTLPDAIFSSGSSLMIVFESDGSIQNKGFEFEWAAVDPKADYVEPFGQSVASDACLGGTVINSNTGEVKSDGFKEDGTGFYKRDSDCYWTINADYGHMIELTFHHFELEEPCEFDKVTVYDGDSFGATEIGQFCGSTIPDTIASSGSSLMVRFTTDASIEKSGFMFSWTTIDLNPSDANLSIANATEACSKGLEINANGGVIQSERFGHDKYPPMSRCTWRVNVDTGKRIELKIQHMKIEDPCDFDNLTVYDGPNESASEKYIFCGDSVSGPLMSSGSSLLIMFSSDSSVQLPGFRLLWTAFEDNSTLLPGNLKDACNGGLEIFAANGTQHSDGFHEDGGGKYSPGSSCSWKIKVDEGMAVQLTFDYFDVEDSCMYDNVTIYDGDNNVAPVTEVLCGDSIPGPIVSSGSSLFISFTSDHMTEKSGFRFSWNAVVIADAQVACDGSEELHGNYGIIKSEGFKTGGVGKYKPNSFCSWSINVDNGKGISLEFDHFDVEAPCKLDRLTLIENCTDGSSIQHTLCGTDLPAPLHSQCSSLLIYFVTDSSVQNTGFSLRWSAVEKNTEEGLEETCSSATLIEASNGTISSDGFKADASQCYWIVSVGQGKRIKLKFEHIGLGNNCLAFVDFDDFNNKSSWRHLVIICGDSAPDPITSATSNLAVFFLPYALDERREFEVDWTAVEDESTNSLPTTVGPAVLHAACNGGLEIFANNGSQHSEGFLDNGKRTYEPNSYCTWKIRVDNGKQIKLTFDSFAVEPSCMDDNVTVYDGDNNVAPITAVLCGDSTPSPILSTGSSLFISFATDQLGEDAGFKFSWIATQIANAKEACDDGTLLTGSSGIVISEGFRSDGRGEYNPDTFCIWEISAPIGKVLKLEFEYFDVEEPCQFDSLEVYDGSSPTDDSKLVTLCGDTIPEPIITSSSVAIVMFNTDTSVQMKGFMFTWTAIDHGQDATFGNSAACTDGVQLNENEGTLQSDGYLQNGTGRYRPNSKCTWNIIVNDGMKIELKFESLQLSSSCKDANITVYDGSDSSIYCGSSSIAPYLSEGSNLSIVFASGQSEGVGGFKMMWMAFEDHSSTIRPPVEQDPCMGGVDIFANSGIQNSKGFSENGTGQYDPGSVCQWNIHVDNGLGIKLTFDSFDVESPCVYDNVTLYNGAVMNNNTLKVLCGPEIPPPVLSPGSYMSVLFTSDHIVNRPGFRFSWEAVQVAIADVREACSSGVTLTASHGIIQSEGYREDGRGRYQPNSYCSWEIHVQNGKRIELHFESFDIESCSINFYDYLDINREGPNSVLTPDRYCGKDIPNPVLSISSSILIEFHSDYHREQAGFKIQWFTV